MPEQNNLEIITLSLNDIQQNCEDILKEEIDQTGDTEEKLALKDIYKVIESDIKCRVNLGSVEHIIPKVSFSDETYDKFIEYSKKITEYLNTQTLPSGIDGAYEIVKNEISETRTFSLQDVFTVISVLITAVALCLTNIDRENLSSIIEMLDSLLAIKERQLNLITEMSKWRNEYVN